MIETRIVGTAEGCDLRISDAPYMSSRHFSLTRDASGTIHVQDLGSTNGTEVNNGAGWVRAYSPIPIGPGSQILAGKILFKIGAGGHVDVVRDVDIYRRDTV